MEADIRRTQNRLLEMAKQVTAILDKHNIRYTMYYGTLLGAIRHKGFIPWDDDFDLGVLDEQYDEGMEWLRMEMPESLFLEDGKSEPLYFHAWAHVKDLKTMAKCDYYLQDNLYSHHGLSIDLYRIKRVKVRELCDEADKEYLKYIARRRTLGLMTDEEYERRLEFYGNIDNWFWMDASNCETIDQLDREVYSNIYTSRTKLELEDFLPFKRYTFEDTEFWGPQNYDAILKVFYGDNYMQLPEERDRKSHYSEVVFL